MMQYDEAPVVVVAVVVVVVGGCGSFRAMFETRLGLAYFRNKPKRQWRALVRSWSLSFKI
jgi:uncharacterized protein YceK